MAALLKEETEIDSFIYKDDSPEKNEDNLGKRKKLADEIDEIMGKQDETTVDLDSSSLNFKNKASLKDDI